MHDFVLTSAICWLSAKDAFAASCVSSEWRATLAGDRDNGELWKQVCSNSHPHLVENFSENFRLLALGLWKSIQPTKNKPDEAFTPTLGPDDFFAVVELYRETRIQGGNTNRKETIASWKCPVGRASSILCSPTFGENGTEPTVVTGPNPFAEENQYSDRFYITPFNVAAMRAVSSMTVSVTLFRRQDLKSTTLYCNAKLEDEDTYSDPERSFVQFACASEEYNNISYELLSPETDTGKQAMALMSYHGWSRENIELNFKMSLVPKIPAAGSDEEPAWLVNCRRPFADEGIYQGLYEPSDEDRASLANISHFEFKVAAFTVKLRGENIDEFHTNEDFLMVFVEGLRWK